MASGVPREDAECLLSEVEQSLQSLRRLWRSERESLPFETVYSLVQAKAALRNALRRLNESLSATSC